MSNQTPSAPILPPGRMFTGRFTVKDEKGRDVQRDGYKTISSKTHGSMHAALSLASTKGYRAIPCEVCGVLSGQVGPIDTREVEVMVQGMAEALPDEAWEEWSRPVQPHRQYLYPELPIGWDSMTFETLSEDEANRNAIEIARAWATEPAGVLALYGPTGVGKTHLASALVQSMKSENLDISVWEFDEWHDTLRGVFDSGREEIEAFEHRMLRAGVLVWDDIRAEQLNPRVREMIEKIVHRRTQSQHPILLTTNAGDAEWQAWSVRAYSRLKAHAYSTWIPIIGADRRLQP